MQISAVVNAAIAKLTAAGAVLVPFDSTPFDQANAAAMESVSYESGDAFSRYVSSWEPAWSPLIVVVAMGAEIRKFVCQAW